MKNTINLTGKLAGKFKLEAIRPDGSVRLLANWFGNLILDAGLERIGNGNYLTTCAVGSGTTAPANGNTALQALIASTTSITSNTYGAQGSAPYYGWRVITYQFATGVAAGNLSEVGVGWGASTMFSRALILDGLGDPTTITVLSDEILQVTYQLNIYPPLSDAAFSVTISGTAYTGNVRACQVTNSVLWGYSLGSVASFLNTVLSSGYNWLYNGSIGADITASPSGTSAQASATNTNAYSSSSHAITGGITCDITTANLAGGISAGRIASSVGTYQFNISPPLAKGNTKTLALNFSVSWARHA